MSKERNHFHVIKSRYLTEKASMLEGLAASESNKCIRKCKTPKYLFLVDKNANKKEIADAIEAIYAEQKVKVLKVNTITLRPKRRTVRGRTGFQAGTKKAIVTLQEGDSLGEKV
jgi:large subunit ribosomal protein L23